MKNLFNIFFKNRGKKDIYIVSGLPRSGTSMMMKMMVAGGMTPLTDNLRQADEDNPKGYYEFERVKKLADGDTAWLPDAQGKVVKIISALLPHLPDEYNYKIVFLRRRISEIMASQKKMLIRRGEDPNKVDDEEMTKLFQKHLRLTEDWIEGKKNVECLQVSYNSLLTNPNDFIAELNKFFGNILVEEKMAGIIDPSLYRQKK